jgi:serine/threonine protein kinase
MGCMTTDDVPEGTTCDDTYATRAPRPESLEAMALANVEAVEGGGRVQGVGLEEFGRGLLDCGFLDADGLRAILAEAAPDGSRPDVEGLARTLVRLGKLTRYQAAALFQGKGKALLIGPYVVLTKLGSGGMGMVFKARLRQGGPEVALKLLPPSASKNGQSVLRFRREAAILERLDHPNIVSSHDLGSYGGIYYLVMDYVEGSDLDRVVRSGGPMKVARAVDCIIQAARGLLAAHERGIVHRDIKPANLLIDAKGIVRVLDLGLARITQADETIEGEESAPSLTASGIIMGTVDFLPPEQSDDSKRVDHRADIYSLGCTLHYLLTGRPPYSGETLMQKLVAHHRKPIPSLIEARPDVPPEVDAVFKAMLAKAPEDRPQSMQDVLRRLEAWRASPAGKSLRVFGDPDPSKRKVRDQPPASEPMPEDRETYDLMTYVRSELCEPEPRPDTTLEGPPPIPPRKSKKGKNLRRTADLALRSLVAAAAIVVLIRFFPNISPNPPVAAKPVQPASNPEPPVVVEAVPPKVETLTLKPSPTPEAKPVETTQPNPPIDRPPPFDPEFGPPPPPPGDRPPPPPPIKGRSPRPGDGGPPRRPGEKRQPRPEDGPQPPRPGDAPPPTPPAGGTIPF